MTLTELRYIVALHQSQHFGKAAEHCCVSQPTLSVAIKKLEESLDVILFERSRNQVRTTTVGQQVVQQAQLVLEQANLIPAIANIGKDPLSSTFSIGAIFTIGPYLFPQLIPQLRQLAPNMPLFIEENYTKVLRDKLFRSELDAIIVALPFTETDIVTKHLYDEPFVVVLPINHPLTAYAHISHEQLNSETILLLGKGHCFREQVLAACPNLNHRHPAPLIEGSSLETLKYMVSSGLGITILPISAARQAQLQNDQQLVIRNFREHTPQRSIAIAWRASFTRPKTIDVLCEAISKAHIPQ